MKIKTLGRVPYLSTWQAMRDFTDQRTTNTEDELWLLEHEPVFTQGQAGKPEHILNAGDIPIIQSDRGGQVTYHGPGQLIAYVLMDIKRKKIGIRRLVESLEQSVIQLLNDYQIESYPDREAPGVYVDKRKICSIGLRVRKGCTFHGLALNVDMDLEPFSRINPCGYKDLKMTQVRDLGINAPFEAIQQQLGTHIIQVLSYNEPLD